MLPAQRGLRGRFPRGTSGNPGGRAGTVRELEAAIEEQESSEVLGVVRKLRELALAGDVQAAKVYLDRAIGPVRPRDGAEADLAGMRVDELAAAALDDPEARCAIFEACRNHPAAREELRLLLTNAPEVPAA